MAIPPRRDRSRGSGYDDVQGADLVRDAGFQSGTDDADALAQFAYVDRPDGPAQDRHIAARRPQVGGGDRDERRLAAAVGAEQDPALARPDPPVDAVEQEIPRSND